MDSGRLSSFVERHDRWYREAVSDAIRLYFNRELSFSERMPLSAVDDVLPVARICRDLGYGFSLSVHLDDVEDPDADVVRALAHEEAVTGLGVIVPVLEVVEGWDIARRKRWMARVDHVMESNTLVGFVGDIAAMRILGVLTASSVGGRSVTLYPHDQAWTERGAGRGAIQARPCFDRMRVYIDPAGMAYPCLGLMVAEIGSFGSIDSWPDETFNLTNHELDLGYLARKGPSGLMPVERRSENLPLVCEGHLAALAVT
ncbi:hypothetical protein [Loktanella sp. SALINAS62]|uniref:hypothetical protein n=1 Tax=Loktanella sp. SALINAS62 TaxID=2706124 RepID=UPI001B8D24BB|nr:hypothetical protein [Loktanella sp. SALINAS62]MBS1301972.1 hypothetical protein [Loktanella sp. SALINAS62]